MSNNNWDYGFNGSENDIQLNNMISPKFAIRGALGDIAMGHLIQNLEEDLLRWCGEAYEKITQSTKAATIYKPVTQVAFTKNNRVKLCDGFQSLQCLKLEGCQIPFLYNRHRCTSNCSNGANGCSSCACDSCAGTPTNPAACTKFYLDGCWVKFSPEVEDGYKVEIAAWATPKDDEGYILVIDKTTTAIQEYVKWKVCVRERDNRASSFRTDWFFNCRQARSIINKKTDAELRAISKFWQPSGFYNDGGLIGYNGIAGNGSGTNWNW